MESRVAQLMCPRFQLIKCVTIDNLQLRILYTLLFVITFVTYVSKIYVSNCFAVEIDVQMWPGVSVPSITNNKEAGRPSHPICSSPPHTLPHMSYVGMSWPIMEASCPKNCNFSIPPDHQSPPCVNPAALVHVESEQSVFVVFSQLVFAMNQTNWGGPQGQYGSRYAVMDMTPQMANVDLRLFFRYEAVQNRPWFSQSFPKPQGICPIVFSLC